MTQRVTHEVDEAARTVATHTLALTWDASSNLVKTVQDGTTVVYVYDSSGQRVAQIGVDADPLVAPGGTATAYLGATEVTDPNTASTAANDLKGSRYYSLGGAAVAVREGSAATTTSTLSFLFGDVQGSAQVMVTHPVDAQGVVDVTSAPVVTRNAYTPYGTTRGEDTSAENDDLTVSHGWLNQVSDEASTGLVYLNARYYDAAVARFLSPDPQMNPSDPKTLDPYRYAENNPITYTDASGLGPVCTGLSGTALDNCNAYGNTTANYLTGATMASQAGTTHVIKAKAKSKPWWKRATESVGATISGRAAAAWDTALNTFALAAPSNTGMWATQRRIAMYQSFMTGVNDYGWGTQLDRSLNPVHQLLEAGDATITSFNEGDYYGVGYNGFNTEVAAGSTLLVGYGGAKQFSVPASTAAEAGSIRGVNPLGGDLNCVNCAVATDATLAGRPASALPSGVKPISVLEKLYGGSFVRVAGGAEIESMLADAGSGARGIVFGSRANGVGHVFNAVNQDGNIRFLDGQTGGVASFKGYDGLWFLRTG